VSQAVVADAGVKVIAPDGELRQDDDRLMYVPEQAGRELGAPLMYAHLGERLPHRFNHVIEIHRACPLMFLNLLFAGI
jgi:hypothetical protein